MIIAELAKLRLLAQHTANVAARHESLPKLNGILNTHRIYLNDEQNVVDQRVDAVWTLTERIRLAASMDITFNAEVKARPAGWRWV